MAAVVHHALLGAAVAGLLGAGSRVAALATPAPLERAVSAVVLAAAAAVVQALTLGLAGLGTNPIALSLAAGTTWLLARRLLPARGPAMIPAAPRRSPDPDASPAPDLFAAAAATWRSLRPAERAAVGAVVGGLAAWGVWVLHRPVIGLDGVVYHLTEIVGWVHSGRPGEIRRITYEYPVGNYPVTNEVLLAWATGLARSFVPSALATLAALGLLLSAGWMGLRALGVARAAAALALAAVATLPLTVQQLGGPNTDLPALAWLVTTAALCACAVRPAARRPGLLAVALVAAALAVGTKTTAAPLAVLVLALGAWRARAALPGLRVALGLAGLAAAVVGGTWYLRNLLAHGSPFWPFAAAPWGDPTPEFLQQFDARFAVHPRATLQGRVDDYLAGLGGAALLLAAAPVVALVAAGRARRRGSPDADAAQAGPARALAVAGLTVVASVAIWAVAPFTGVAPGGDPVLALTTTRYLLPGIAAAAVALALASRTGGATRATALTALGAAVAWNVVRLVDLGHPWSPPAWWVFAAATALAAAAAATSIGRARPPAERAGGRAVTGGQPDELRRGRPDELRRGRPDELRRGRPDELRRGRPGGLWRGRVHGLRWGLVAAAAGAALAPAASGYVERHARARATFDHRIAAWFADRPAFGDADGRPVVLAPLAVGVLAGDRIQHEVGLVDPRASCARMRAHARRGWVVIRRLPAAPTPFARRYLADDLRAMARARCLASRTPLYEDADYVVWGPPDA